MIKAERRYLGELR